MHSELVAAKLSSVLHHYFESNRISIDLANDLLGIAFRRQEFGKDNLTGAVQLCIQNILRETNNVAKLPRPMSPLKISPEGIKHKSNPKRKQTI